MSHQALSLNQYPTLWLSLLMKSIMSQIILLLTQGDFLVLTRAPSWLFNVIMLLYVAWWTFLPPPVLPSDTS